MSRSKEKGFQLLSTIASFFQRAPEINDSVEFVFQAYISDPCHRVMEAKIRDLEALAAPNVHLVKRNLSPEEYAFLLKSSDLLLLPYDIGTYFHRTSGPFAEALSCGIPTVVPDGTWMASQVRKYGGGRIYVPISGDSLMRELVEALRGYSDLKAQAERASQAFVAVHNPHAFVNACFS